MNATSCPTREVLLAYHTGQLPEASADEVLAHLGQCARCQATVSTFGEAKDSLIARLRRPPVRELYSDEPQCREFIQRAKAMANGTRSNVTPEAGTSISKKQDLPPTQVFAASASSGQAVPRQLREYRILEKLGQGGMGTVYKALHTRLDKLVALKVLPAEAMKDPELVARFDREMKAVGKLGHPNIVRAMDAGCHEGTHFLVMEFVDGMNLGEVVRRFGPLRIADACEVIRQAALGLRHADEHALVHRDIKPSNLVLSADGEVKILDLGLALLQAGRMAGADLKSLKSQAAGEEATGEGRAMGTLDYMAPEQVRDSHSVDIRADIYSLGCTLYKLLTGQAPFTGPQYENTFNKMMAHLNDPFPPIRQVRSDVPETLAVVLQRMVAKDRSLRYVKPSQVVEDLKSFCPGSDLAGLLVRARKALSAGPARGAGLPTPPKRPTARSPESPAGQPQKSGAGRPAGQAEGGGRSPAPSAQPASRAQPKPGAPAAQEIPAEPAFDPYYKWLGIPPDEQPPNYYRLLGIRLFEEDRDVIQNGAAGRSSHLRTFALGKHSLLSQRLLSEIEVAKVCLLTPKDKAAYDARLRQELEAAAVYSERLQEELAAEAMALPAGTDAGVTGPVPASSAEDNLDTLAQLFADTTLAPPLPPQAARSKASSAARTRSLLQRIPRHAWIGGACTTAVVALLSVIYIVTGRGTVKIELSDPNAKVEVKIDGDQIDIAGLKAPLRLSVGEHELTVTGPDYEAVGRSFAVRRGDNPVLEVTLIPIASKTPPQPTLAKGPPPKPALAKDAAPPNAKVESQPQAEAESNQSGRESKQEAAEQTEAERNRYYSQIAGADRAVRQGDVNRALEYLNGCPVAHRNWEWGYLKRLCELNGLTRKYNARIHDLAVSPDSSRIALAGRDGTVTVRDVATGNDLCILRAHAKAATAVAFAPDGNRIVSGGEDKTAKVWDISTGEASLNLETEGEVACVAFSYDGRWIAVGQRNQKGVIVCDVRRPEAKTTLAQGQTTRCVAFSPDGWLAAADDFSGHVTAWDTHSGKMLWYSYVPFIAPQRMVFSPDGRYLAAACRHATVRVLDAAGGKDKIAIPAHTDQDGLSYLVVNESDGMPMTQFGIMILPPWDSRLQHLPPGGKAKPLRNRDITCVAYSPDGSQIAAGDARGIVQVWNVKTRQLKATVTAHSSPMSGLAYLGDGNRIITTGTEDKSVKIWDQSLVPAKLATCEVTLGPGEMVYSLSPDGKRAVVRNMVDLQKCRFLDLATGELTSTIPSEEERSTFEGRTTFSADWKQAAAIRGRELHFLDRATGQLTSTIPIGEGFIVQGVSFSPDGKRIRLACNDGIRLWDANTREPLPFLKADGRVNYFVFAPDNNRLVGVGEKRAWVWDTAAGRLLFTADGLSSQPTIRFTADGKYMASWGHAAPLELRDAATGTPVRRLVEDSGKLKATQLSDDGKRFLGVLSGVGVKVWDVPTGKELYTLRDDGGGFASVTFLAGGKSVLTAAGDGRIRTWDGTTGRELMAVQGPARDVRQASLSPDGRRVVSVADDAVVVWDAQTGHELLVFTLPAGVRAHGAHFFGRGIECFAVPSRLIWLASDWVDQHPDAEKKP